MRSSAAILAAASLAASPIAAAAPEPGVRVAACGDHAPVSFPMPTRRKKDMPKGCHAACAALREKKKRLLPG